MTKVKICGITNIEDARHAVDCGADELGFNFYEKSQRLISPEAARSIIDDLPISSGNVGVFVNKPMADVLEIVEYVGLDVIQLHGDEDLTYLNDLRLRTRKPIIKAFRMSSGFNVADVFDWPMDFALFDTHSAESYGGGGKSFDWKDFGADIYLWFPNIAYLAGGLNSENVADGIRIVRPYAVDVASGVESSPGVKDPARVAAFIEAVRKTATSN